MIEHSNKFNVKISNANILDLFSGSGSFGLECVSRGANKVTFVENYKSILNILKRNIDSISADGNYEIIEKDCFTVFESEIFFKVKFDIIFIDPPYKEKKINFFFLLPLVLDANINTKTITRSQLSAITIETLSRRNPSSVEHLFIKDVKFE